MISKISMRPFTAPGSDINFAEMGLAGSGSSGSGAAFVAPLTHPPPTKLHPARGGAGSSTPLWKLFRQMLASNGRKDHSSPRMTLLWTSVLVVLWYCFAISGTIASKSFMSRLNRPTTLAGGQMAIAALLDVVLIRFVGLEKRIDMHVVTAAFPIGVTLTFGRFLTYFSYETVAASLTQTVKASSPVFTVILLYLVRGRCQAAETLLSLIPIVVGVLFVCLDEMELKLNGTAAALLAGLSSTLQSLIAKTALREKDLHPLLFHMCACAWAAAFLIPLSILTDGSPVFMLSEIAASEGGRGVISRVVFFSFVCFWGQNLASTLVLSQMGVLSHQVANVSRRFFIILCSMVYFDKPFTLKRMVGICLALGGFYWFGYTRKRDKAFVTAAASGETSDLERTDLGRKNVK